MKLAKRNTKVWDYKHDTKSKNNQATLTLHKNGGQAAGKL